jgi:hypothetical protein
MGSFVDKKRAAPPAHVELTRVVGYDPDTDIAGWAVVYARLGIGTVPSIQSVLLLKDVYTTGKRGQAQANHAALLGALTANDLFSPVFGSTYGVVEGQQVYPDPDATRQKLVAQANDLLHLALVAGSVCGVAAAHQRACKIVLPKDWKKQRTKPADHQRSIAILIKQEAQVMVGENNQVRTVSPGALLGDLGKPWEHALDALGIALYGFDLLSTNRWDP